MSNSFSVSIRNNSYGNVQRIRELPNGRVLYGVVDAEGKNAGHITVPIEQADTFESSYQEILETAPKIEAYISANSSEENIAKRRNIARGIVAASGLIGAGVPLLVLRKSTSVTKKILGAVTGVVVGLAAGFVASLGVTTPPGAIEYSKATRELAKLDIKPVFDEKA